MKTNTMKLLESIQENQMSTVSIWQVPNGAENREYRFRTYDEVKDVPFDELIKRYKNVGTIPSIDITPYDTIDDFLEATYIAGNDGVLFGYFKPKHSIRSISVGDIIQVDNDYYYVDSSGFVKLN